MTDLERDRLRQLQDRWLELPVVKRQLESVGWQRCIAGPNSPTYAQVREMLLPQWSRSFGDSLRSDIMTDLECRANVRVPLTKEEVKRLYVLPSSIPCPVATLCESHERLRADFQEAVTLLNEQQAEIAAVLAMLVGVVMFDGVCNATIDACRDRLRKLTTKGE